MAKIKTLTDIKAVAQYLSRIGAEPRSLRTAVVREMKGKYWKDIAVITITPDGEVRAGGKWAPTEEEASAIAVGCKEAEWPKLVPLEALTNLPKVLKDAALYEFKGEDGKIIMLQQRLETKDGKAYIPWTYWDDGEWRAMEPDGKLPLWGIDQLREHSTAFVHEGAKAAAHMAWMVAGGSREAKEALAAHPWGEELSSAAHLGWIGGALSPWRTDWSMLRRMGVKRVYIVSDNDEPGLAAVPNISYQVRLPTWHIQFTNEWPPSFDLADDFPEKMFKKLGDKLHYIGPSFRSCMHPATWATDQIPPEGKGKPKTVLRDDFKNMWAYVEEADLFVCKDMPEILRTEAVLNKMLSSFSHVQNTTPIILRTFRGRQSRLCYRPDIKGRIVTDKTTSAINLHTPSNVKAVPGDPGPWLEFLEYMFPMEEERHEVMRWCATLIAKPNVRMEYALLLISEEQGVGKTTLGAKVLAPLVGYQNSGFPGEDQIVNSDFNGWAANKRLVVVGEIYSGHSWKAYNRLKGYITDKEIEVNEKYMKPYMIENWVHVVACSNSRKALKMEQNDRRWFYPQVTEERWPREKFGDFYMWLESGGLQIIKHWAEKFGDYVSAGQRAPSTSLKKQMMDESRSEAQKELADLCEACNEEQMAVALASKEVMAWLKERLNRIYDSEYELGKVLVECGFKKWPKRLKVGSQMQYVYVSPAMAEKAAKWGTVADGLRATEKLAKKRLEPGDDPEALKELQRLSADYIRLELKHPGQLSTADM
jgi:hypothetical protein